jgi:hypothetical protein
MAQLKYWDGSAWVDAVIGAQGTQGPQGTTGNTGSQGLTGIQGTQGTQGVTGSQGLTGSEGVQGTEGIQGIQGIEGVQGIQGSQGTQGVEGSQGTQGLLGIQGIQGTQGVQGTTGIQGTQGVTGASGVSSSYFEYRTDTNSQTNSQPNNGYLRYNNATQTSATAIYVNHLTHVGVDIDMFLALLQVNDNVFIQDLDNSNNYQQFKVSGAIDPGNNTYVQIPVTLVASGGTGTTGFANNHPVILVTTAVGIQGTTGTQGLLGSQGTQGLQGIQGIQGTTGIQGLTGTQGTQGLIGLQGTTGSQGINGTNGVQGTEGIQGTTGSQGINGTNGVQGTEGIQGTTGSQGINGTNGVQGTEGIQGTTGSQGINGTNGVQGTQGIQGGFSFGLGTGVETFLSTPSSANLAAALTDETGTGANVFATSPTLTTPKINENVELTATSTELNLLDGVTATTTELNYVDGVTSAIQTQIDTKAPLASPTFTGTVTIPTGSAITGVPYLATANTFTTSPQQINAESSAVGLIVKANATTPGDLQQWQDSAAANQAWITSTGSIQLLSGGTTRPIGWNTGAAARATINTTNNSDLTFGVGANSTILTLSANAGFASTATITNATPAAAALIVKGAASQTANLQEWQNSDGTVLATVNSTGEIRAPLFGSVSSGKALLYTAASATNEFRIDTNASTNKGLVIRAAAAQTANIQEWQSSTGTVLSNINNVGAANFVRAGIGGATPATTALFVTATSASGIGIIARAAAAQTANIQEWQITDGTVRSFINPIGRMGVRLSELAVGTESLSVGTVNTTDIGIVVRGVASQTANLQEWQNNAGTVIASIGPAGSITTNSNITQSTSGRTFIGGATDYDAFLNVGIPTATRQGIVVRANASQTANLQEWQNSSGTILANVSSSGGFTVPSLTVSGDFTVNGTTTNINTTNLVVEDKNIVLGDTTTPTDITADGGGITLKGTTDKTFNWVDSTDSWTSSEHINLASGKSLYLNNTLLKDATETLTNKTLTSPTIDTPLLTLSTTSSTTDGRIAWDSTNDKILVGGTLNSVSQAVEFASSTLTISTPTFTTNAYTVVLADKDKWLELSNGATAGTLNIPTDATANFAIGTQLNILQTGAGQITIAAVTPGTTTVNGSPGLKLRGQWSAATIVKRSANTWVAVGDLSA